MQKKNCHLDENVVQIGSELPEMHNTSRELHDAFVDVVKVRFAGTQVMKEPAPGKESQLDDEKELLMVTSISSSS